MSYEDYCDGYDVGGGVKCPPDGPSKDDYVKGSNDRHIGRLKLTEAEFNERYDDTPSVTTIGVSPTGAQREKLDTIPYDLVPYQEITDAYSRVAEYGAKKYSEWNWSLGLPRVQLICSLLRHTFAYLRGEERDSGTGLLHTDHILWNAATLSHNVHHNLEDGRRVEPPRDYKQGGDVK